MKSLNSRKPIRSSSSLLRLSPILGGGRLRNSLLDEDSKHPLILPAKNRFVQLLVEHAHLITLHGGTQLTLITVRRHYWILKGRQEVKSALHKCTSCIRYSARAGTQMMSDLPSARVLSCAPFQRAGVDYAGPFSVRLSKTRGRGTMKGYIALLICMSTRAVHLEIAEDYSSEAFLGAFHRFTARRGHCAELYSDCGTNFVGADKQLREMFAGASIQYQQITYNLSHESTTWTFNPPSAPHFEGLWEAAVKAAKRHLRRVIGEQILTFVEYSTLLCRIEACLNSRPLIPLSDNASELYPLTPAHFLIQRCSFLVPEPEVSTSKVSLSKRWELVTQLAQHFWRRWSSEYLSTLQLRLKWQTPTTPLQKGDMVLVKREITPPGKWPLGRITDLHPGADGLIRVPSVQTSSSIIKAPVVKLIAPYSPQA